MGETGVHKGWHSRGYLPHLDAPGEIQALTFRLADSVPNQILNGWRRELVDNPDQERELLRRISRYEDAGHGRCLLRKTQHAVVVQGALLHADGTRYRLIEWCIMPNHVHALIKPFEGWPLGQIIRIWKTYTAHLINQVENQSGTLWSPDYHDRYIRDNEHFADARSYIQNNPVKAGLCLKAEEWPWGSAWRGD